MPIVRKKVAVTAAVQEGQTDVVARPRIRRKLPETDSSSAASPPPSSSPPAEAAAAEAKAYVVGDRKPPKHTQFRKGVSGNPRGRPKGALGMKTLVRQMLTEKVMVRTASGAKRMSKMEAMLHKIAEQAFAGNMRALQQLVSLYATSVPDEPVTPMTVSADNAPADMDAHDEAILATLRATLTGDAGEAR